MQDIGRKLVQDMWPRATTSPLHAKFAVLWATHLGDRDDINFMSAMTKAKWYQHRRQCIASSVSLWRAVGFCRVGSTRWFALSADSTHPAHKLPAGDDYNPPEDLLTIDSLPVHEAIRELQSDEEAVALLEELLQFCPYTDPAWQAVDSEGNAILHLAGYWAHPKALNWMLRRHSLKDLLHLRNHRGETPIETCASNSNPDD